MPGQGQEDIEPDEVDRRNDPDDSIGLGWTGCWVDALREKMEAGEPLGSIITTYWNSANDWGVEVRLE
ncbi:hypothetical protein R3P38DRAFT_3270586, partial [Favolaschia claudopus]